MFETARGVESFGQSCVLIRLLFYCTVTTKAVFTETSFHHVHTFEWCLKDWRDQIHQIYKFANMKGKWIFVWHEYIFMISYLFGHIATPQIHRVTPLGIPDPQVNQHLNQPYAQLKQHTICVCVESVKSRFKQLWPWRAKTTTTYVFRLRPQLYAPGAF